MTEIEKTVFDLIRAALSDLPYEIGGTVDPVALYRIVRRQHLSAFLWKYASRLPDSPVRRAWEKDKDLATMKELTVSEEKEALDRALSASGIRFLYLKGSVLKRFWGDPAFRYMGDTDFLYEGDDAALHRAFEECGYAAKTYGTRDFSHHFVFHKDPWFTVEPHYALFDAEDPYAGKLTGLFDRAAPDPELPGRYLISEEDLYLHCLLHVRRHIEDGGIGVRSCIDFAFLLRAYPDLPERTRVKDVVSDCGLERFEERLLGFVLLFSDPSSVPDEEDEAELSILFGTDLYGSLDKKVSNKVKAEGRKSRCPRLRYFLKRAFPPLVSMSHRKIKAPLSWLVYPFFWLRRAVGALFSKSKRKKAKNTVRILADKTGAGSYELRYFGLSPEKADGREETDRG